VVQVPHLPRKDIGVGIRASVPLGQAGAPSRLQPADRVPHRKGIQIAADQDIRIAASGRVCGHSVSKDLARFIRAKLLQKPHRLPQP